MTRKLSVSIVKVLADNYSVVRHFSVHHVPPVRLPTSDEFIVQFRIYLIQFHDASSKRTLEILTIRV